MAWKRSRVRISPGPPTFPQHVRDSGCRCFVPFHDESLGAPRKNWFRCQVRNSRYGEPPFKLGIRSLELCIATKCQVRQIETRGCGQLPIQGLHYLVGGQTHRRRIDVHTRRPRPNGNQRHAGCFWSRRPSRVRLRRRCFIAAETGASLFPTTSTSRMT